MPIFTGVFLLAAAVTAVLSLDATVVLLTPVVVAAAVSSGTSYRPGAHACLRMANSASLLLPVSNLTNLLAMPHLDLTFGGFALVMAPVLAVVLVVEYVALRLLFRRDLAAPGRAGRRSRRHPPLPPVPLVVVVLLMLVGFARRLAVRDRAVLGLGRGRGRAGRLGPAPPAADHVRTRYARRTRRSRSSCSASASSSRRWRTGFLGDWVSDVLPDGTDFASLLLIAVLATVLANLLTNLSATLLLVPLLAPLGDTAVLAALLGLNIGSGLSYTGSLANLLWRRGMVRLGHPPSLREFHRVSLLVTPISLVAAVAALSLVT